VWFPSGRDSPVHERKGGRTISRKARTRYPGFSLFQRIISLLWNQKQENLAKSLHGKIAALETLIRIWGSPDLSSNLDSYLSQMLEAPEPRQALDEKFDEHIAQILKSIENREALAALLRTPTKGLPN
jgi:hypothetical protein